jgi:putative SOS response-associated peptidase YedK
MCGRFTLTSTNEALMQRFGVALEAGLQPRYNIAPGQQSVILTARPQRQASLARFGIDGPQGKMLINARSETIAEKPTFRGAFAARRCLVPASGWFEWQEKNPQGKHPWYICLTDQRVMGLAGLLFADQQGGDQFVIVTAAADGHLAKLHHRTPLVLPASGWSDWLSGPASAASQLLASPAARYFDAWPVSHAVGKVANDHADLIMPAKQEDTDLFARTSEAGTSEAG